MSKYHREELTQKLGQEKADKLARAMKNYDNYMNRFKKEIDSIIGELGFQVQTGLVFSPKGDK